MIDLEAAEKQMRADIALATSEGMRLIQEEGADADFIRSQRQFDEARIQFTLACMKCDNLGIGRNELLSGAGHALGTMWGNLLMACVGERERAVANGWVQNGLQGSIGQQIAAKSVMSVFPVERAN